ncbi:MAG: transposase [Methanophagales archaeon]|nr:transposase [Methanophagales archaeon]
MEARIAKESAESEDVKLLMGIPGVNYYTALLLTSEIGDFSRFSKANKLVSWLGLAPRVHQSGDTIYNGRITKEGSPRVRWALVQAARSAVQWDDHYRTKYQSIKVSKNQRTTRRWESNSGNSKRNRSGNVSYDQPKGGISI